MKSTYRYKIEIFFIMKGGRGGERVVRTMYVFAMGVSLRNNVCLRQCTGRLVCWQAAARSRGRISR